MEKNRIYSTLIIIALSLGLFSSCDYLNVVPDDTATEEDAFKDRLATERYLYSCYSFLPISRHETTSIDLLTADEVITSFEHETFAKFPQGDFSPTSPIITYWYDLYQGIRQSYLLLDNIQFVSDMSQIEKDQYAGQATYLIAYYHWLLLRCYGPILIIRSTPDLNMNPADYPARTPYDECVDWIADKFDEAVTLGLPAKWEDTNRYGLATSIAAKAIKARMLLTAASPQFNGGFSEEPNTDNLAPFYSRLKNGDGEPLFNIEYKNEKWTRAAEACKEAIKLAEDNGIKLYDMESDNNNQIKSINDPTQYKLRMTIIDKYSSEIIWADTRKESEYGLQNKSAPRGDETKDNSAWNGVAPTLAMVETFYTKNGLPINEDPMYDYQNRYDFSEQANGNGVTMNLNQNREPRFDAWISYHNGNYEYNRGTTGIVKTQFRYADAQGAKRGIDNKSKNYSPTGYLNKKAQHPLNNRGIASGGKTQNYPWSIIRLAELYLSYAEALVELGDIETAKLYIDPVRERAGLKGLDATWATTGIPLTKSKMRQIVRQERTIEFYLENQRFWDVRRWLQGRKFLNVSAQGMTIEGSTNEDFFKVKPVGDYIRKFRYPQHYLMPFPSKDMDKNQKLVQNPGY